MDATRLCQATIPALEKLGRWRSDISAPKLGEQVPVPRNRDPRAAGALVANPNGPPSCCWQREQHRWGWKGVKRWLRRPNGSWNTITTPAAVLFDPTKVRIERYRYRGNRIPNPYDLTITA